MQIKLLAKALRLGSVEVRGRSLILIFHEQAKLPDLGIQQLINHYQGRIQFLSPRSFEIRTLHDAWPEQYGELNQVLQGLTQSGTNSPSKENK
jgi:transcription-repair coupling factor (superfamily II helicase)